MKLSSGADSGSGRAAGARRAGVCAGSSRAGPASTTMSQSSLASSAGAARIRRSWASSTAAGTDTARARFRSRHTAGSVSNSTATAGSPPRRAWSR
jgi:hypothetical protein